MRVRLLAALVVIGCLAACSTSGRHAESSKADFIRKGDAICDAFSKAADAFGQPKSFPELVALLDKAIAHAEATHTSLAALTPPADGKEVQAALVKALDDGTVKIREARVAAAEGNAAVAGAAMDAANQLGKTSDAPAKAYGFRVCGSEAALRSASGASTS